MVATLYPAMLPVHGKTRQHCCAPRRHKKFFWRFSETFFVSRTQNGFDTNVAHVAKRGHIWETWSHQQCCRHNVSSFCRPHSHITGLNNSRATNQNSPNFLLYIRWGVISWVTCNRYGSNHVDRAFKIYVENINDWVMKRLKYKRVRIDMRPEAVGF